MKRISVLALFLMLLILPGKVFSQSGFPKILIINGDTLVAITKNQRDKINLVKIERDYYKQYADSLEVGAYLQEVALVDCKELNKHFEREIEANNLLNKEQRRFIKELREDYKEHSMKIEKLEKTLTLVGGYSIAVTIILLIILL